MQLLAKHITCLCWVPPFPTHSFHPHRTGFMKSLHHSKSSAERSFILVQNALLSTLFFLFCVFHDVPPEIFFLYHGHIFLSAFVLLLPSIFNAIIGNGFGWLTIDYGKQIQLTTPYMTGLPELCSLFAQKTSNEVVSDVKVYPTFFWNWFDCRPGPVLNVVT